jgi:hypothetical protein
LPSWCIWKFTHDYLRAWKRRLKKWLEQQATITRSECKIARPEWLEHSTYGLEIRCSIRLSYGRNRRGEVAATGPEMQLLLSEVRQMKSIVFVVALVAIGLVVAFSLRNRNIEKKTMRWFVNANYSLQIRMPLGFRRYVVGLIKEPFIAGIDSLIDKATARIPDAQHGFRVIFSARHFPARASTGMTLGRSDGNLYYSPEFSQEGWLCLALFKHFRGRRGKLRKARVS